IDAARPIRAAIASLDRQIGPYRAAFADFSTSRQPGRHEAMLRARRAEKVEALARVLAEAAGFYRAPAEKLGAEADPDVWARLLAAVVSLPAAWPDGFGLALLEAPIAAVEAAGAVELWPAIKAIAESI